MQKQSSIVFIRIVIKDWGSLQFSSLTKLELAEIAISQILCRKFPYISDIIAEESWKIKTGRVMFSSSEIVETAVTGLTCPSGERHGVRVLNPDHNNPCSAKDWDKDKKWHTRTVGIFSAAYLGPQRPVWPAQGFQPLFGTDLILPSAIKA